MNSIPLAPVKLSEINPGNIIIVARFAGIAVAIRWIANWIERQNKPAKEWEAQGA